ncbi:MULTISPECIES: C40 family peptidase [Micromonospora]|uniref:C40 family peptidase n=1 Tax=Micromonospora carbonacea TaxID=47853 RepID=A0A1C5AKX0_9ACTN|nr:MULTISPECIES: C40 family peptidase [Micromonospora]MBB5824688.1 cell wall-associated NlpC family hydrolase [Micromonospora carbonacea]MDG4815063.1 NlpC/P60 family protein [Micromonospora sp. WMMD956]QLD27143.1 C40 family peptidase [Micromonospora carbonacea]WFE57675.1 NlpC/P60 family protein [Micromonospora sp. WMMD712]SCF45875.1 Cell wall-associated hydrolase, NlpC family [Micromonospora carbonacea]
MSSLRNSLRALVTAGLVAALIAPAAVARAEPTPAELTRRIEKSSTELERVVESYNKLAEDIKANKATAAKLAARIGPLEEQTAQSRADVGTIAVTAYKSGRLDAANALLSPGGPSTLLDRLDTLDQLSRQRQQRIAGYTENQRQLLDQKGRLDATLAKQAAQAKQLTASRKRIEKDLAELYEMRRQAYGRATEPTPPKARSGGKSGSGEKAPAVSGRAGAAVRYAYGALGKPYVWAADGPNGYDCSGLTSAAWRAAGKSLPHNTRMQWGVVSHISRSELRPGDLVFYNSLGHVAIYVGDGQVIHAPTFGRNVEKRALALMPPYGYGRVR